MAGLLFIPALGTSAAADAVLVFQRPSICVESRKNPAGDTGHNLQRDDPEFKRDEWDWIVIKVFCRSPLGLVLQDIVLFAFVVVANIKVMG